MSDKSSFYLRYTLKDEDNRGFKGIIGNLYPGLGLWIPYQMVARFVNGMDYFFGHPMKVRTISYPAFLN